MHSNEEYKQIFSNNIKLCRIMGLWSGNSFFVVIRIILQNFACYGSVAHFFLVDRKNGYPSDFIEDVAFSLSGVCLTYTAAYFEIRRKHIIALTKEMSVFKIFEIPFNFERKRKLLDRIIMSYNIILICGAVYYLSINIISKSKCLERNEQLNRFKICGVISQVPNFDKITESPQNEILAAFQFIAAFFCSISTGFIYSFMFNISEHIIIRINYLKELFMQLDEMDDNKIDHLRRCIEYHNYIIRLVESLNFCFSDILFAAITIDTLVIGAIMVQYLVENSLSAMVHLGAWVFTLLILSTSGQRIYDESLKLQEAIYNLTWYNESPKYQRNLQMIIFISQKNLCLKTGKLGIMSFSTFVQVIKTSYSYVAVLRQRI